jgi:branched-chain amino acid transport system substrate-binding protein
MAIQQAKSTEGKAIKAALEDLQETYEGVTGTYTKPFSTTDHEAVKEANVRMGVIKDGAVVEAAAPVKK